MRIRDYVLLGIILVCVVLVLVALYKKKKTGRCIGCSGNCAMCDSKMQK